MPDEDLPPALPEGFLPPRYEDVRPLGLGGMASVHIAHDAQVGRSVVVKVLDEGRIAPRDRDECRRRFVAEARAAAAIHHPNVITVLDTGTGGDGRPYIVMEHMPRGSLGGWTGPSLADPATVAAWITAAGKALDAAHRAGVIHRDVKPDNLLLDADGWLKVSDFGIARVRSAGDLPGATRTGMMLGTLGYMAPEIYANAAAASPASDVWALAATAYRLLTGTAPYGDGYPHGTCPPASARRSGLTPEVDRALARGLAEDPGARPGASAFAAGLAAALEGATSAGATVPVPAAPAAPAPPTRLTTPTEIVAPVEDDDDAPTAVASAPGRRDRRRRPLLAGAAILVAVGGAAIALALSGGEEPTSVSSVASTTALSPTPPALGPPREVRMAALLVGGGSNSNCFGEGVRPNGVARFTLRPGEAPRERDFVQCGTSGDPAGAAGVYRFGVPELPAGSRVVAVEGFFGIEPQSRADHGDATISWLVSFAGRELCAPSVGPGEFTDERIGGRACRVVGGPGIDADGTLEISQSVDGATPGTRLFAGVVAPTLIVREPVER